MSSRHLLDEHDLFSDEGGGIGLKPRRDDAPSQSEENDLFVGVTGGEFVSPLVGILPRIEEVVAGGVVVGSGKLAGMWIHHPHPDFSDLGHPALAGIDQLTVRILLHHLVADPNICLACDYPPHTVRVQTHRLISFYQEPSCSNRAIVSHTYSPDATTIRCPHQDTPSSRRR